jgi:hypothetical protein
MEVSLDEGYAADSVVDTPSRARYSIASQRYFHGYAHDGRMFVALR